MSTFTQSNIIVNDTSLNHSIVNATSLNFKLSLYHDHMLLQAKPFFKSSTRLLFVNSTIMLHKNIILVPNLYYGQKKGRGKEEANKIDHNSHHCYLRK